MDFVASYYSLKFGGKISQEEADSTLGIAMVYPICFLPLRGKNWVRGPGPRQGLRRLLIRPSQLPMFEPVKTGDNFQSGVEKQLFVPFIEGKTFKTSEQKNKTKQNLDDKIIFKHFFIKKKNQQHLSTVIIPSKFVAWCSITVSNYVKHK